MGAVDDYYVVFRFSPSPLVSMVLVACVDILVVCFFLREGPCWRGPRREKRGGGRV